MNPTEDSSQSKGGVLDYSEKHPHMMVVIIVMCVLVILYLVYANYIRKPAVPKKSEPKPEESLKSDEKEIDSLIKQIETKQKTEASAITVTNNGNNGNNGGNRNDNNHDNGNDNGNDNHNNNDDRIFNN
jgi:hypothetical protein